MADESNLCTTSGEPVEKVRADQTNQVGQHKAYVVLCAEERAKGFVRPYRDRYRHVGTRPRFELRDLTDEEKANPSNAGYVKYEPYPESESPMVGRFWTQAQLDSGCGTITTMGAALSETYARQPEFYGATFCVHCNRHLPVGEHGEFVWVETDGSDGPRVGT